MDFVKIDESIRQTNVALAAAIAAIKEGNVASDDVWVQVLGPVYLMRDQARPYLKEPESVLHAGDAVADWSKPNFESAVKYGDRYVAQLKACRQYLEISQHERIAHPTVTSAEELNAMKEFNAAVKLAFGYAICIRRFAEAESAAQHPAPPAGPGPFGSNLGVPGYFASAIDEINQKLDNILAQLPSTQIRVVSDPEIQSKLDQILAWTKTQTGTGLPPVPQPLDGVVGAMLSHTPWHSTAGIAGMYGSPGQPRGIVGQFQYDALFAARQSATMLTVSGPPSVRVHITLLADKKFWVSVGADVIPQTDVAIILTDVDAAGVRVVQRIHV